MNNVKFGRYLFCKETRLPLSITPYVKYRQALFFSFRHACIEVCSYFAPRPLPPPPPPPKNPPNNQKQNKKTNNNQKQTKTNPNQTNQKNKKQQSKTKINKTKPTPNQTQNSATVNDAISQTPIVCLFHSKHAKRLNRGGNLFI